MGQPIRGLWAANNANANDYVGALKWGTGINPIHSIHGEGPPLRSTGRVPGPEEAEYEPSEFPAELNPELDYGYSMEDLVSPGSVPGYPPPWGEDSGDFRNDAGYHPPWGPLYPSSGSYFRTLKEGADMHTDLMVSFPTTTVSEGWENKLSGDVNDAEVSSDTQYTRQTSMQQVNPPEGRNNSLAVARGTDDMRANIMTRLTGMKIKPWSDSDERRADMFPYQQDQINRPFWYRTAATDDPSKMSPNEMYVVDPVQRAIPPDPYMGPDENADNSNEYGYVGEDVIPYA